MDFRESNPIVLFLGFILWTTQVGIVLGIGGEGIGCGNAFWYVKFEPARWP
jgi:hypothetical protein